ncbi:DEAD/DEAH box helicase [Rivularia sp. UHCC 0363]|uniref:DEAD/DEAH box helicase n=1 Tax=Rivularia sp. UHCC 0363 TaxID=3110244 RepID=UPI002B1F4B03|nr:DEAD/DEAH box helicase [Rivularia sp. UHCC 0363]MEA5594606.1 DEAD/DEAH box helicase [Rivularia sp. UHCC 0363]
MAILHGSWLVKNQDSCFFVWGETWRSISPDSSQDASRVQPHHGAMTPFELLELLRSRNIAIPKEWVQAQAQSINSGKKRKATATDDNGVNLRSLSIVVALPTHIPQEDNQKKKTRTKNKSQEIDLIYPLHSAIVEEAAKPEYLQPWQVNGFRLNSKDAIKFLTSLPMNVANDEQTFIGGDLRFWSQVARWGLDLIARCKFLPKIENADNLDRKIASWTALIDSAVDESRLDKYSRSMPLSCRVYQADSDDYPLINLPPESEQLLLDFLNKTIDAQVRAMVNLDAGETRLLTSLPSVVRQWLYSLSSNKNSISADTPEVERLEAALNAWTMPLQNQLGQRSLFRTCFVLRTPEAGKTEWLLEYYLQAIDDEEFLLDAQTIWNHPVEQFAYQNRTIDKPQETFLRGLGLASRLYPIIAPSLDTALPQFCRLEPIQAYDFIKSVTWRLEDSGLGVVLPPSLANRDGWANRLGLKVSAQTPKKNERLGLQSLLNFRWELAIGGQTLSQQEFNKLVALNSPLVEINGEWVELRSQDIKTAQTFFASRKEKMALSLEDALRLGSGDTQTIEKLPVVSFEASGALQELITNLTDNQEIETLPTPESFRGELRPYQRRGMSWLSFLERWGLGACLADDMGLGKTIQFIAFLLHLQEQEALEKPTLLVCPTSVLGNWEREVKKFAPNLKVLQYHGDKRPKGKAFQKAVNDTNIVITSYSLVHRDLKLLQDVSWQIIALDEAQNVKNPEAKQSQAVRQLEPEFRIALTGTPVENRLQELWSIMDFLNPGYLGTRQFFQRRFAMPIEKYGDTSSLSQLRSLVQPFILRRLKTDRDIIQDLPEKQEMTVFCGLTPEQAKLYQKVVEDSLAQIDDAEGLQRRGMILGLLVKLKQICNHPAQYLKKDTLDKHDSAKLQRLEEMLEEVILNGDRALIFTQFAEWGKLLKPYLEKYFNREALFLYGSTTQKKREEMIDRFQHDPQGPPIMILSLKAGGVGLNLTRANHVFHFDRWWNPAVENQATDRVFRIGQTKNVQVHKFVCTGTLEEKIHDMIESKKQLAEQVVGAGEEWLTEMDTDQLRNLLILDRDAVIEEEN